MSPALRALAAVVAAAVALTVGSPAQAAVEPVPGVPFEPSLPAGPLTAPDPLDIGTVQPPSGRAPAPPEKRTAALDLTFPTNGYQAIDVPEAFRPWHAAVAPRVDTGLHDASGVRMYVRNGVTYNHPVAQAQYGFQNLSTYRRTNDLFYLDRAVLQANRLINTRVEARGGWFFPYRFDFSSSSHPGMILRAPWYSAMAQGEATGLFTQLAQIPALTEEQRILYRRAADGAFTSLTVGSDAEPWVVHTDASGYLWLQEYPVSPEANSDFTYNGHLFAAMGVWDYVRLTGNEVAATIFDGAITTAVRYASTVRNPAWYSSYCVRHRVPSQGYHLTHINLMLQMQWLTGRWEPAAISDLFVSDYPPYAITGQVVFAGATHTFYRFTAAGVVSATKRMTFTRRTAASTDTRIRIKGRGIYYKITNGAAAGWYVPEVFGRSAIRGIHLAADYRPERRAIFVGGRTFSAYSFDGAGNRTGSRTSTFTRDSSAPFDRRALVEGRMYVRIAAGGFARMWVPSAALRLDR
jgi:hypothetical protein